MNRNRIARFPVPTALAFVATAALAAGCSSGPAKTPESGNNDAAQSSVEQATEAGVVTITDNHGDIEVPAPPQRLVALDNTAMQTLVDWGVTPVAVPKGVMGDVWPELTDNAEILDVGNHREPDLEAVITADPDLIIGGYRFASYYDDLRAINPTTIEISPRDGEDPIEELKRQTTILGEVFSRQADAKTLNEELDKSIADAKSAYNGTDSVVGLITSGGTIAFAAPGDGRGVGLTFPTLGLVPGIDQAADDAGHGDEISVEAIAQASPEWLIVLDRDGALGGDDYVPAKELIEESEALQAVPAVAKGQIIYLDPNFYLTEGIQAYTSLFSQIADSFSAAK